MKRLVVVAMAACLAAPHRLPAQAVLDSPNGPLEVIGLRRWTLQMLQDSIAAKAPGQSLRSHACAAILQQKLGFPAAAVNYFVTETVDGSRTRDRVIVTVVEPQDSALVRWRSVGAGSALPDDRWARLRHVAFDSARLRVNELLFALQFYGQYRMEPEAAAARLRGIEPSATGFAETFWRALAEYGTPADLAASLAVIAQDSSTHHRLFAVMVLANFAAHDDAWRAAAAAMRDPEPYVRDAASGVLRVMARHGARVVDWTPAGEDLRALIGGTNLWAYRPLLDALARTGVEPALAGPLVRGNSAMLVAHLRAASPEAREVAVAFARQLSGRPSASAAELIAWAEGL